MNKPFVFPFANKKNEKGLTLDKVSSESLLYLIERSDCNDPQYGERNSKIVAECNKVLNERAQGQTVKASVSPASQTVHATTNGNGAPTASMTLLKQVAAQQAEHGKVLARILGVLNSNFPNSQEVHTDEEFDKF